MAARVTLCGRGAASADLTAGFATGATQDGFGLGIGIGSIAAMAIGAAADGGAAVTTLGGVTIAEDCLSGVMATSGGALAVLGEGVADFSGTTITGVLGAALGAGE